MPVMLPNYCQGCALVTCEAEELQINRGAAVEAVLDILANWLVLEAADDRTVYVLT